mgnify:CR=1 FL=1
MKTMLQNAEWYNKHQTIHQPSRPVHQYKTQQVSPDKILRDKEVYDKAIQCIDKILNPVLKYKKDTGKLMTMQQLRRRRLQRQKMYANKTQAEDTPREKYTEEMDNTNTHTTPEYTASTQDIPIYGFVTFTPAGADWFSKYNDPYFGEQMEVQALARRIVMLNPSRGLKNEKRPTVDGLYIP